MPVSESSPGTLCLYALWPAQIWLSTSTDLHHDAIRDLRALGSHITVVNNCQTLDKETRATGLSKSVAEGVLFMYVHVCEYMTY